MSEPTRDSGAVKLAARVRALHQRRVSPVMDVPADHAWCVECRQSWPCATVVAVDDFERERDEYEQECAAQRGRDEELF